MPDLNFRATCTRRRDSRGSPIKLQHVSCALMRTRSSPPRRRRSTTSGEVGSAFAAASQARRSRNCNRYGRGASCTDQSLSRRSSSSIYAGTSSRGMREHIHNTPVKRLSANCFFIASHTSGVRLNVPLIYSYSLSSAYLFPPSVLMEEFGLSVRYIYVTSSESI